MISRRRATPSTRFVHLDATRSPYASQGAWGANEIIMPDGARFSMLEADPMKLTYY